MNYPHPDDCPGPRLVSWRRDQRNSRLGFAAVDLRTVCGPLEIGNVIVSQSHGSRFVAMPAGAYIANGQARYTNILKWPDGIDSFRDAVIALVERRDPEAFQSSELVRRDIYRLGGGAT